MIEDFAYSLSVNNFETEITSSNYANVEDDEIADNIVTLANELKDKQRLGFGNDFIINVYTTNRKNLILLLTSLIKLKNMMDRS